LDSISLWGSKHGFRFFSISTYFFIFEEKISTLKLLSLQGFQTSIRDNVKLLGLIFSEIDLASKPNASVELVFSSIYLTRPKVETGIS